LLKKIKEKVELWRTGNAKSEYKEEFSEPVVADQRELFLDSTLIILEIMRIFMLRSVMVWSRTIQDKYTRELLNFTIFSKLFQMQVRISETLGDVTLEWRYNEKKSAFITLLATELSEIEERIHFALSGLGNYKIKKEIEPMSNFIIKMIKAELARLKIYSHTSAYKWNVDAIDVEEQSKIMANDNPTRFQLMDERTAAGIDWSDYGI
jgi:hypothetical protein